MSTLSANQRRRRGAIAHLPKTVRDQISQMLADGLTYREVISKLGDAGKPFTERQIQTWHNGGYKDWLKDCLWLEEMRQKLEFACNVLQTPDTAKIHEASLLIAVKQMFDLLTSFKPNELLEKLASDGSSYARILNSLSKLTEAAIRYDRLRAEAAHRKRLAEQADAKALGMSEATQREIEEEFGITPRFRTPNAP